MNDADTFTLLVEDRLVHDRLSHASACYVRGRLCHADTKRLGAGHLGVRVWSESKRRREQQYKGIRFHEIPFALVLRCDAGPAMKKLSHTVRGVSSC
jgi:hypothetical protein